MNEFSKKWSDPAWVTGFIALGLQLVLFCLPMVITSRDISMLFMANMLIVFLYLVILMLTGRLKKGREGLHPMFLFLLIFLVSAYALNRAMNVFEDSVNWLCCLLVATGINYIGFYFFELLPAWVRYLQCFILGVAMLLFVYLALYLLPLYGVSIFAAVGLGISLHTFVPLLFVLYTLVLLKRIRRQHHSYLAAFGAGVGAALVVCIVFVSVWCVQLSGINEKFANRSIEGNSSLPSWVNIARDIPHNAITEKILKTGLVYRAAYFENFSLFEMPSRNFAEQVKHDPLVVLGIFFGGRVNVPEDDRIKILEAMYNARHQAQQQLWPGDHLVTEQVNTEIDLWPDLYMSYSEMSIVVANEGEAWRWNTNEEAIYTFQLPEGGVVTSLSLWINGKEEKGMLTTQAKADSAYKAIVGVQRRDPSVVHWQEGNTVTVRVFPVVAGERRKFKIGVTAPLSNKGKQLQYQSAFFKGPSYNGAREAIKVHFMGEEGHTRFPSGFTRADEHEYVRNGSFRPDWELMFDKLPLADKGFTFDRKNYHIHAWERETGEVFTSRVYLDVNAAWTREEFNKVFYAMKDRKLYVASETDEMQKVTADNKDALFVQLSQMRFSLFPFHKIKEPATALVVTKGTLASPGLHDIKGFAFINQLRQCFAGGQRIRVFSLNSSLSPYLRSLKEFRAFHYEQGDVNTLEQLVNSNRFAVNSENGQQVVIDNAGIAIEQADSATNRTAADAPDHLVRLFAYNHILQKAGTALLAGEPVPDEVIGEAAQAYIVSPASSLIVLERQKDYDDFDIKASKNSLQNAAMHSKGAVPEPHEWALIILVIIVLAGVKFRPQLALIRRK